jgi:hypothetical protein
MSLLLPGCRIALSETWFSAYTYTVIRFSDFDSIKFWIAITPGGAAARHRLLRRKPECCLGHLPLPTRRFCGKRSQIVGGDSRFSAGVESR